MRRLLIITLLSVLALNAVAQNLVVVRPSDARTVVIRGKTSTCSIDGKWDLTAYRAMKATVTNLSQSEYLQLNFMLTNSRQHTMSDLAFEKVAGRSEGVFNQQFHLEPGATKTFTIYLPGIAPHPEVAKYLTLMKVSPYAQMQYKDYNADFSDIRTISVVGSKMYKGSKWRLESLEFVPGARRDVPAYMKLDSAAFFPFIDKYGQFKHKEWPGKTHSDADLKKAAAAEAKDLAAHPGPGGWDRFGGWADGPQLEATGHFRVQKLDGKWWMVDPDGHLFFSHGIVRVNASCAVTPLHGASMPSRRFMFEELPAKGDSLYRFHFTNDRLLVPYYERWQEDSTFDFSSANIYRKYGPDYKNIWADLAHRRLRSWGMNTIANSSDWDICHMSRTPYIDRFDVISEPIAGADGAWFPIMDPYDPSFREAVERNLRERQYEIDDPYNLGFFVDNEIRWGDSTHAAKCVASAPETQAAKIRMREFLRERYGRDVEPSQATRQDLKDFNAEIIDTYYRVIRESFDKLAPGVLYMGCRFAGFTFPNEDVVRIGAKYCDVISHNQYRYTIDTYTLPKGVDKPVMVGEWHLGACDRGLFYHSLIECRDQKERGEFYEKYATSAIRHPNIIGIHWHQFMDQATTGRFDGENMQVGFLDCCDTPYQETVDAARRAGYGLYEMRYLSPGDIDLRLSGVPADGKTKVTAQLQKAIDKVSKAGGGRVVLEGGVFLTGPVELKSGVQLHIEEGAVLLGSPDLDDYPDRKKTRHFDTSCLPRSRNTALIYADEAHDVAITGGGTIDCNGKLFVKAKTDPDWKGWAYERSVPYEKSIPRAVFFAGCSNVRVEQVTMINQPAGWSYWVHDCDSVEFTGCKILADVHYPNNDGIHVNCSRDVNISDCDIQTGDDAIVLRANSRSLRQNKACERVVVKNCRLRSWSSAVRMGWVNDGVIRDCHISDITMYDCSNGISCYLPDYEVVESTNDYGREATVVENITFENITMDKIYGSPIYVCVRESEKTRFEAFRNITFRNIRCHALQKPFFNDRSGAGVGVKFENCTFTKDLAADYPENPSRHGFVGKPGEKRHEPYHVCAFVWPSCHDDSLGRTNWGEGMGEWEVIRKGTPRFEGHYQPKEPLWGYEMDNDPEVVERWINTALGHGVNTFVYDWYWFEHYPYLESALNDGFLKAPSNGKMEFFIMWANHNVKHNYWNPHKWGDDDSLLWSGKIDPSDWPVIVERVIRQYFGKPNYTKIDGKPVFAIFSTQLFIESFGSAEAADRAMNYMREKTVAAGFPGLHFMMMSGGGSNPDKKHSDRIDLHLKVHPDSWAWYNMGGFDPDYIVHNENAINMRESWDARLDIPVFPTVSIAWDDTPRFPAKGFNDVTRLNQSPEVFEKYLRIARKYAETHAAQQPRFVFINAWNEWVEGSYLLPDKRWGFGYLQAVQRVFAPENAPGTL